MALLSEVAGCRLDFIETSRTTISGVELRWITRRYVRQIHEVKVAGVPGGACRLDAGFLVVLLDEGLDPIEGLAILGNVHFEVVITTTKAPPIRPGGYTSLTRFQRRIVLVLRDYINGDSKGLHVFL